MTRERVTSLAILIVVSLTMSAARAKDPESAVDNAASMFAKMDGIRVHYKSIGKGETAVVFIHGWTCDLTFWRFQVPALQGKARILLIDLPGHGKSDKPKINYTIELFARSVNAVMQDAGVNTAVVVGHSMGTPVARQFFRLYPKKTKAVVAVDGALRLVRDDTAEFDKLMARLTGPGYKENQAKFIDSMLTEKTPAEVRKSIKDAMQSTPQHVAVSAMKGMFDPAIWKDDKIEVPLQVINAKSPYWSAEYEKYVRKLAPQLDYRVMDGVGHFLMLEKAEAFNELLLEFLKKQGVLNQ